MTKTQLTSRERVNRMFARQDHDRIPRYDSYWPETITRWQSEGLVGDEFQALQMLETDYLRICVVWPSLFPGQHVVIEETEETEVIKDQWGATGRFWKAKSGTPEHIGFDCNTSQKWHDIYKPTYVNSDIQSDLNAFRKKYDEGRELGQWVLWFAAESFESTRKIIGDEIILMAMITDSEWVRDVSKTYTDHLLREFNAIYDAGIKADGIFLWGDMAYKIATFCSPQMYRELIWPDHKRIIDWVHERDLKLIYHTDGNVNGVIDMYIEAGVDCLQPLECKANMDVRNLCPQYGKQLAFMGNIDIMKMIDNDRDVIEAEVATKLAAGKMTKGYTYHSDHSIPPQVSWETYKFIVELVDKYGNYE